MQGMVWGVNELNAKEVLEISRSTYYRLKRKGYKNDQIIQFVYEFGDELEIKKVVAFYKFGGEV